MTTKGQSFTAIGTSDEFIADTGSFSIDGTFVGTVELQVRINNVFEPISVHTAATTETSKTVFDNGVSMPMRFEVTAFTSGIIGAFAEV